MTINNISDIRHLMVYYNPIALDYVVWDGSVSGAPGVGGLTNVELRALPVPVSVTGGGDASAANQVIGNASLASIDLKLTNPVPVSGTFFQATQPVSGNFFQATQPVSGTFFQATQPVSGTFWQATQPVSGTFFQATQPVSIAGAVAVTGVFWQATQPISAVALPLPTGAATEARQTPPVTSATTDVSMWTIDDATRNVVLLATNANRKGARLTNLSGVDILIGEGYIPTPVKFCRRLKAKSELEISSTAAINGYMDPIPDNRVLATEWS